MGVYAVIGGSHGIGAKTVELLKKEGHEVINIDLLKGDITADLVTLEGRQKVIDELHAMHPEGLDGLILSAAVSGACGSLTKIISLNYFGAVSVINGTYDLLEKKHGSCVAVSSNVISQGIARMDIADLLNNCGDDGHHVPQCQSFLKRPADPDPVRAGNLHGSERDCSCHCFSGFRKSLRHQRHRDVCGRRYGCALKYGKSLLKGGF